MIIDILGYRDWARKVYDSVSDAGDKLSVHWHTNFDSTCNRKEALLFLVGWSDLIPDEKITGRNIFVVHPSPLPRYRGGSPLQHQIMAGEKVSAVTIFQLKEGYPVDGGPIVWQMPFSLEGKLSELLSRITVLTAIGIENVVDVNNRGILCPIPQIYDQGFAIPRRKPEESEILRVDLNKSAEQIHNKIRALNDPYPNAYIVCGDGKKLYLTESHLDD